MLSNQRHKYQNMCASIKIDPLSVKTHLFKAVNQQELEPIATHLGDVFEKIVNNFATFFDYPKLGWEKYNISTNFDVIPVDGDHHSMMMDPDKRASLGKEMNKVINPTEK